MPSSRLFEQVFRTVGLLPPSTIAGAAAALEAHGKTVVDARRAVMASAPLPQERVVLAALLDGWEREENHVPAPHLATALRSSLYTRAGMERTTQVGLVWTGPPTGLTFRRTEQALLEVVNSAAHHLLLITFAAYNAPLLRDAVRRAVDRGVTVSFLGESATQSGGRVAFDAAKAFGSLSDQIRFHTWPLERRGTDAAGSAGALHAKCALTDDETQREPHRACVTLELGDRHSYPGWATTGASGRNVPQTC